MTSIGPNGTLTANTYSAPRRSSRRGLPPTAGVLPHLPRGQLAVVHDRVGDDAYLVACRMRAPAEIDVVAAQRQVGVEAAELVPDVAADQHARGADGHRGAVSVVLALIDLTELDSGDAAAGPVDGDAPPRLQARAGRTGPLSFEAEDRRRPARRPAALSSSSRASGAGSQSSCSSQIHSDRPRAWIVASEVPARAHGHRGVLQGAGNGGAVTRLLVPCRRLLPGRAARSAQLRCGPGCRCPPRPRAAPDASAPASRG